VRTPVIEIKFKQRLPEDPKAERAIEALLKELVELARAGDNEKLATRLRALALENPDAWFARTFPEKRATALAAGYKKELRSFPDALAARLTEGVAAGHAEPHVKRGEAFEARLEARRSFTSPRYGNPETSVTSRGPTCRSS
jgi:hypothetical protein